jgi:hypothetical protein
MTKLITVGQASSRRVARAASVSRRKVKIAELLKGRLAAGAQKIK